MITYKPTDHFPKEISSMKIIIDNISQLAMAENFNYEYIQELIIMFPFFDVLEKRYFKWSLHFKNIDDDSRSIFTKYFMEIIDYLKSKHYHDSHFDMQDYWGKIRGTLFEECVSSKLIPKYKYQRFKNCEVGCVLCINNKEIIGPKLKSVDFSGNCSNSKICEVVEIKINPNNFSKDNFDLFNRLKIKLDNIQYTSHFYLITTDTGILSRKKLSSISDKSDFIKDFSSSLSDINFIMNV